MCVCLNVYGYNKIYDVNGNYLGLYKFYWIFLILMYNYINYFIKLYE